MSEGLGIHFPGSDVEYNRYSAWECPKCGNLQMFRKREHEKPVDFNPKYPCPECSEPMKFEWTNSLFHGIGPLWTCRNEHHPNGPKDTEGKLEQQLKEGEHMSAFNRRDNTWTCYLCAKCAQFHPVDEKPCS